VSESTAILIASLVGIALQIYRENRARRWQIEDREYARQTRQEVVQKIDENTAISQQAAEQTATVAEEVRATVTEPLQETAAILKNIAERPILPVAVVRRDDAEHIIDQRQHRAGPPGRRKDDPR
jgi:hypothetical protein